MERSIKLLLLSYSGRPWQSVLQIETVSTENATATLIRVRGDMDITSASAFQSVLAKVSLNGAQRLIVSLENCAYIDSTGLHVLIKLRRSIGQRLKVVVPKSTSIRRVCEITGLVTTLNIVDTLPAALDFAA